MAANLERIYTIPFAGAYETVRNKRSPRAVKIVREFAIRHMKAADAKISEGVNALIFRDGIQKPPRRIKVRIVKGDDQMAKVWLVGEEEKIKQAEDAKKKAEEQKKKDAEKKAEEAKKTAEAKKASAAAQAKAAPASAAQKPAPPQMSAPAKPALPATAQKPSAPAASAEKL